ncbi:hypothetical protein GIX45_04755 [Erwinia sp. CPCC 100877]|nr:hypothetical protein [Erwinia sp. CPCC 100877]
MKNVRIVLDTPKNTGIIAGVLPGGNMVQLNEQRDPHQRLIAGVAPVFFFLHPLSIIKKPLI